jgi:hypothetical protein
MNSPHTTHGGPTIDMELIAQRIVKLAEIATLEHLETLVRSQAEGLIGLVESAGGTTSFSSQFGE